MRAPLALVFTVLIVLPSRAADAPVPDGWTRAFGGTYTHTQSGVTCPSAKGGYDLVQVDGPSDPYILGTCQYSGGKLRIGKIRLRTFVDGAGETPLAIQNDRALMGKAPADGVPPGGALVAAYRGGPGPVIDGTQTAQFVLTSVANGVMVDCITQSGPDPADRAAATLFLHDCAPPK